MLEYDRMARAAGRDVPDDDLQRLLDARAALADRLRHADEVITARMVNRLAERLAEE